MTEAIIWEPIEVRHEAEILGLDVEGLIDCIRYAERERSFVTANDAIGFASYLVYDKLGRALRERYLPLGWVKDDSNNQCAIKNQSTMVRVVPCNFDENAGNRLVDPTNKSPKGEISRKKSHCNRTAWLPGIPRGEQALDDGYQTWVLGVFIDEEKPTKAELSLPIAFEGNHFSDFGKRIVLLTGEGDELGGRRFGNDQGDDDTYNVVDINIRRR